MDNTQLYDKFTTFKKYENFKMWTNEKFTERTMNEIVSLDNI